MALITNKCVFMHLPKAGGIFIRSAFKACKIPHEELGEQHSHFPEIGAYRPPEFFQNRYIFTFVRHPLTWYQSRWAFRLKHGWKLKHPLDFNCASNDFHGFIKRVLAYKPSGWLSYECDMFINDCPYPINKVGRVENLTEDLIEILTEAGEDFDPKVIRKLKVQNDSNLDGLSSKHWGAYTPELAERVIAADSAVVNRYYRGKYEINPSSLVYPRPW